MMKLKILLQHVPPEEVTTSYKTLRRGKQPNNKERGKVTRSEKNS
jgi:hypothetical protein